ncbi:666_t:CDS:2 [Entrophospora sp. SA101]|nr:2504_t:CDS:2 [Entrophospora sp. SA101]CAJ0752300.1 666_t:CDS:2 [Entrophospora sp. SA101]CAJ0867216.1 12033_t:CDS:2 [Entrophospora sp. SA101]CAJ0867282.1 12039_t:CDS:2 [Entrophospora sp. SA101]CAJ0875541.1 5879_t:CDS:2 [Entrophospora sp. SA101]
MEKREYTINMKQALVAGGIAGTAVDTILYPLDTIKTRLQSKLGLYKAGSFRGIYSGITSVIIGSAPGASAFFVTYEFLKKGLINMEGNSNKSHNDYKLKYLPLIHMVAASGVPTEVIKQRMQTKQYHSTLFALRSIFQQEGIQGFYRGYLSTVINDIENMCIDDIPFTCIQFPLYEYLKVFTAQITNRSKIEPWEASICGSIAGGVAAGLTTPLDVVKTRVMLSAKNQIVHNYSGGVVDTFNRIIKEEGARKLFSGIGPRVLWISIGRIKIPRIDDEISSESIKYIDEFGKFVGDKSLKSILSSFDRSKYYLIEVSNNINNTNNKLSDVNNNNYNKSSTSSSYSPICKLIDKKSFNKKYFNENQNLSNGNNNNKVYKELKVSWKVREEVLSDTIDKATEFLKEGYDLNIVISHSRSVNSSKLVDVSGVIEKITNGIKDYAKVDEKSVEWTGGSVILKMENKIARHVDSGKNKGDIGDEDVGI